MKKSMFYVGALLITLLVLNIYCKEHKAPTGYSLRPPLKRTFIDTSRSLGVFVTPNRNNILQDIIYVVRFDSVPKMVETTSGNFKSLWGIDTAVFVPRLDTLKDSVTHHPIIDSAGKMKVVPVWEPYPKELVILSDVNIDSAVNRLKPFMVTKK